MAQISRPFQIAFVGIVLLAGVWLFALQGHSSSSSSGSPGSAAAPAAPSASAASGEKAAAAKTPVLHGSAPGVEGLTKAIAKAHGAVATSQQNARELQSKSDAASDSASASASSPAASSTAAKGTSAAKPSVSASARKAPAPAKKRSAVAPTNVRQRAVEAQLASGAVVVILFWNKNGADDLADRRAVASVAGHGRVDVQLASAGEVAAFGSITRGVQVYGTPTILIVPKSGTTITLTGLTDTHSLQQSISDARSAAVHSIG